MATFAKATFNASVYSSFRPTYPKKLFNDIFDYHRSKSEDVLWDFAVDLGCGTGQATMQLSGPFHKIIGIDPSRSMIETARLNFKEIPGNRRHFSFAQGDSGDLNMLKDGSVDLIISAQAAHWFDWEKVWPETSRVLRTGGSLAFWTYAEFNLSDYPSTAPLIAAYARGKDPTTSVGPYFERPGRTVLEDMLTTVPDPTQNATATRYGGGLGHFERRYYAGSRYPSHLPPPSNEQIRPIEMQKDMRWRDLLGYLRTWSALYNFHQRFPEDLNRVDERLPEDQLGINAHPIKAEVDKNSLAADVDMTGGDIAVRFWKDLREEVKKHDGKYGVDEFVSVEWPIALLLAKKL